MKKINENKEIDNIITNLRLLSLIHMEDEFVRNSIITIFRLSNILSKEIIKKRELVAYQLNAIDELHAGENAHSRILGRLLQIHDDKQHHFVLQSFLHSLAPPFSNLDVDNPIISIEENRIDARIRHKNYSIIIENKIHNAQDQEKQITRYVEIEKENGYKEDNIYILYLSRSGGGPSEVSFPDVQKKQFCERYLEINYRQDIRKWLKELILYIEDMYDEGKIKIIRSALIQYIDHLNGLFYDREGERGMNEKIFSLIDNELGLKDKEPYEQITALVSKSEEIERLKSYIDDLINKKIFDNIRNDIRLKIVNPKYEIIVDDDLSVFESMIKFIPQNWKKRYCIGFAFSSAYRKQGTRLYFGIYDEMGASLNQKQKLEKLIGKSAEEPTEYWPWGRFCEEYLFWSDPKEHLDAINNGSLIKYIEKEVNSLYKILKDYSEFNG